MPKVVPAYKEDMRRRILEAASKEFKQKGYFRTTMDDIASDLGVSHGSIYQYFESKESILEALYSSAPENLRSTLSRNPTGMDPIKHAQEVFDKMATRSNAELFVEFLAEASRNSDFQKIVRENIWKFNETLEEYLKAKHRKKLVREEIDLIHSSTTILGLVFNGLFCWLVAGVPEAQVREVWKKSLDILLRPIVGQR